MIRFLSILAFLILSNHLFSQYAIRLSPRVSPDRSSTIRVAFTDLSIFYGAPSVNARAVAGGLIPYQNVWRAGANEATRFKISQTVYFGADSLAAGEYALFIIARPDSPWTVIFNRQAKQWGAFRYDESQDALRISVLPQEGTFQEVLSYQFHRIDDTEALLQMHWGNVVLPIKIGIDFLSQFKAEVERQAAERDTTTRWIVYLQGAEYLVDHQLDLTQAATWLDLSENLSSKSIAWNSQFYPKNYIFGHLYWTRAKLLAQQKKYSAAIREAERMLALEGKYRFAKQEAEEEQIEARMQEWRSRQ